MSKNEMHEIGESGERFFHRAKGGKKDVVKGDWHDTFDEIQK